MKLLLSFALMLAVILSPARADRLEHLPGLAPGDHLKINSEATGRPYHIFVRLPEGYDKSDKTYPIVYALDGDILFPILGAYHLLLSYDEPVPDAIMVGIAYGTFDPENGNFRTVDYSTPQLPPEFRQGVDDGSTDGGAAKFQSFIADELIPAIEAKYRANPARRILIGQSRGAHFVLYSAYTRPDLFWGRIASNPSLKPGEPLFYSDLSHVPAADTHLFLASGEGDIERLRKQAIDLFAHLVNQEKTPWHLNMMTMKNGTHSANITNVYRDGMKWFFRDMAAEDKR